MQTPKLSINNREIPQAEAIGQKEYNLSMYGRAETPMMELRENGDIYVKGEKAMSNQEVATGLLTIFNGGRLPTDQINVRVLKPLGYYDDHAPGETLHIKLSDATELIREGYVEIVVNEQGQNFS